MNRPSDLHRVSRAAAGAGTLTMAGLALAALRPGPFLVLSMVWGVVPYVWLWIANRARAPRAAQWMLLVVTLTVAVAGNIALLQVFEDRPVRLGPILFLVVPLAQLLTCAVGTALAAALWSRSAPR